MVHIVTENQAGGILLSDDSFEPHGSRRMGSFVAGTRKAVAEGNWLVALVTALTLPDICASISADNGRSSGVKYAAWWDTYVGPRYTRHVGTKEEGIRHQFLTGDDAYALRCAFLHNGSDDTTTQHAAKAIQKFWFIEPPEQGMRHCDAGIGHLLLQVDIFCEDHCLGVQQWLLDIRYSANRQERLRQLATTHGAHQIHSK